MIDPETQPLARALAELLDAVGGDVRDQLVLGGGYGLYLRQQARQFAEDMQTVIDDRRVWPAARSTKDLDVYLHAELFITPTRLDAVHTALQSLGYQPFGSPTRRGDWQFERGTDPEKVIIDLLIGDPGEYRAGLDSSRAAERVVKPKQRVGDLAARRHDHALALETHARAEPLRARLADGSHIETTVRVPHAFTYLLLKLFAVRNCLEAPHAREPNWSEARKHALDLFRVVAMTTEAEDTEILGLAQTFATVEAFIEAQRIRREWLADITADRPRDLLAEIDSTTAAQFIATLRAYFDSTTPAP